MTFSHFAFTEAISKVSIPHFGRGSITVSSGPHGEVTGDLNCGDETYLSAISVELRDGELLIQLPARGVGDATVHLDLAVPDGLDFLISAGSAEIEVNAPIGKAKIASGSGEVLLAEVQELDCTAGSGDITVHRLTGNSARLTSGSGDIDVAETSAAIRAKSGSGDVTIRNLRGQLNASTGSGDITVPSTTGTLDLRTASGDITIGVADKLPVWLDLDSVSGNLRIALDAGSEPAPGERHASIRARTASGEIAVYRA